MIIMECENRPNYDNGIQSGSPYYHIQKQYSNHNLDKNSLFDCTHCPIEAKGSCQVKKN